MRQQFYLFLVRWGINTIALAFAVTVLVSGNFAESTANATTFVLAGLVFSLVNVVLRPIIVILSLPAILLTLGLFMLVINGILVYVTLALIPDITISFVGAVLAGMVISLTNYVLSSIIESYRHKRGTQYANK